MNKHYYCLCEDGKVIQNDCNVETLQEVQDFLMSLGKYTLTIKDFESLIQIGKLEKHINGERFLILVKDNLL